MRSVPMIWLMVRLMLAHVVAAGDVAVAAEAGQVAPQLGGGDAHQGRQLVGVDELDLVEAQLFELAPVDAQALHRVEGDLLILLVGRRHASARSGRFRTVN